MKRGSYEVVEPSDYAVDDLYEAAAFAARHDCMLSLAQAAHGEPGEYTRKIAKIKREAKKREEIRLAADREIAENTRKFEDALIDEAMRQKLQEMREIGEALASGVTLTAYRVAKSYGFDWRILL